MKFVFVQLFINFDVIKNYQLFWNIIFKKNKLINKLCLKLINRDLKKNCIKIYSYDFNT